VSSRLDYANGLLHGTSVYNINRLQVAQNFLVRTVFQAPRSASATELRRQLHGLPVRQRISYKVAVITYKTRSTSKLAYLSDLLQDYRPARTLQSSDIHYSSKLQTWLQTWSQTCVSVSQTG